MAGSGFKKRTRLIRQKRKNEALIKQWICMYIFTYYNNDNPFRYGKTSPYTIEELSIESRFKNSVLYKFDLETLKGIVPDEYKRKI